MTDFDTTYDRLKVLTHDRPRALTYDRPRDISKTLLGLLFRSKFAKANRWYFYRLLTLAFNHRSDMWTTGARALSPKIRAAQWPDLSSDVPAGASRSDTRCLNVPVDRRQSRVAPPLSVVWADPCAGRDIASNYRSR